MGPRRDIFKRGVTSKRDCVWFLLTDSPSIDSAIATLGPTYSFPTARATVSPFRDPKGGRKGRQVDGCGRGGYGLWISQKPSLPPPRVLMRSLHPNPLPLPLSVIFFPPLIEELAKQAVRKRRATSSSSPPHRSFRKLSSLSPDEFTDGRRERDNLIQTPPPPTLLLLRPDDGERRLRQRSRERLAQPMLKAAGRSASLLQSCACFK